MDDVERNKALIRRYFAALDERDLDGITALLATDCVFHRSDRAEALAGLPAVSRFVAAVASVFADIKTDIHMLIAEDDLVASRITHVATLVGVFPTRLGPVAGSGRTLRWTAMQNFRARDGKIAEQWTLVDELSQLLQLDAISASASTAPALN